MIGSIAGNINYKGNNFIIVDVAGLGYKIFVTPLLHAQVKINDQISLVIHTYVREDQINLYGFEKLDELEFFELLLTVSGIGPKSALGIMSLSGLNMIKSAIASEDPSVFTKVSGIGRKTAERVIVELKGKIKSESDMVPLSQGHSDVVDALVALGYSQQQARDAMKSIPVEAKTLQEKLKWALRSVGK